VHEALTAIRDKHAEGNLVPLDVVDAARPKKAPLHPAFEWDNSVAAEQYRVHQARNLIRSVRIVVDESDAPTTPAFVHVEVNNYQPIEAVISRPDLFELALAELHRKFSAAERAVRELESAATQGGSPDRMAAIGLAVQGFETVREALAILR